MPTEAAASVPTEDGLITRYVAVDTWWQREGHGGVRGGARPSGPAPAGSEVALLTRARARARECLARRSERAWRAEVLAAWQHRFPRVPQQAEGHRRVRWRWGAFEPELLPDGVR